MQKGSLIFSSFKRIRHIYKPYIRASSTQPDVCQSIVKTCGVITLNRPKSHNAFNLPMILSLDQAFTHFNDNPNITHVVLEGAGEKSFCSGGDVVSVIKDKHAENYSKMNDFFRKEYQLEYYTAHMSKPTIAIVDGVVMGGGVGISIHNRFRVATETTLFSMPEASIGLFTDAGGGFFLPRLRHNGLGLYLALNAKCVYGSDNVWSGFATHFVEKSKLKQLREEILNLELPSADDATNIVDKLLCDYQKPSLPTATTQLEKYLPLIKQLYGDKGVGQEGTMEALIANIKTLLADDKLGPETTDWLQGQLDAFSKFSPTSLKVILYQLQQGRNLSLVDDFKMEYRLSHRIARSHDFTEGVRAFLKDKDHKPLWKPSTLEEVSIEHVKEQFLKLDACDEWNP